MDFYTKDWVDYINKEWNKYVSTIGFFSIYDASNIEICDDKFDDKLIDEFKKYYDAKKKYVGMTSELEKKFGDYEKIEIKSYDEELKEYKDRVDVYANELKVTIYKNIGDEKFSEVKNVDFKLLLLGFVNSSDYSKITKYYQKIFNRANAFLTGYYQYENYLKNYIDKKFFDIWFHDCKVIDMIINNNDLTLVIDDGYWPYDNVYYLTFVNVLKNNIDKSKLPFDILSLSVYYTNNKFYLYIEEDYVEIYEIVSDGIKLDIKKKINKSC